MNKKRKVSFAPDTIFYEKEDKLLREYRKSNWRALLLDRQRFLNRIADLEEKLAAIKIKRPCE